MVEPGGSSRFSQEPLTCTRVVRRGKKLDCDLAVESGVDRQVDFTHPTDTQSAFDAVMQDGRTAAKAHITTRRQA